MLGGRSYVVKFGREAKVSVAVGSNSAGVRKFDNFPARRITATFGSVSQLSRAH